MMGVHDVGARQHPQQAWREGLRRVPAQPAKRGQRAMPQTAIFAMHTASTAKGDQLALDVAGQRPRQLERIALATPE